MTVADIILLAIRWLHALAAVAWVGGGIFYLLVLRPELGSPDVGSGDYARRLGEQFRQLVYTSMAVLLVTGAVLTVTRLTSNYAGVTYVVVLAIKIALAVYMFYLVRFLRHRTYPAEAPTQDTGVQRITSIFTSATTVLVIGVIVFLLADILRALVEVELEG